jgi:hypothetical protein
MNLKHFVLLGVFIIRSLTGYSQHDPDKEILVFFTEGVTQKIVTDKGKSSKTAKIVKEELKRSLNTMGIVDSLIEAALPEYKADTSNLSSKLQVIQEPDMSKLYRIKVPENRNRKELIDKLKKLPEVLYAEINSKARPAGDPIDVDFHYQWALKNTINPGADIHAIGAWDIYKGNANNIIAIIDGGIPSGITDLAPKISGGDTGYGWDGHGGHVAGIAAAVTNNGLTRASIAGVDWYAKIHPQRVDNGDVVSDYQAIIDAVNYSPNVHVLNLSWTLEDSDGDPVYSITVRQAIAYAYKKNRINIAASGNYQDTHPNATQYPAGYDNVLAVGATTSDDRIWPLSSQGNYVDVSAPGNNIMSFYFNNTYSFSGTSQASPHVSGIASLLKGYNPNLANDDIENIIELSADKVAAMNGQNYAPAFGFGRVNAERALQFLKTPYTFSQLSANSGTVYSTSGTEGVNFLGAPGLATASYLVKRIEVRKNVTFPKTYSHIVGVWGRGVATSGWNGANPNFGEGYCSVVPGSLTNSGVKLRTYVYEVWNTAGGYLGFFPNRPESVNFAYTVLAAPGISGPYVVCSSGATFTIGDVPAGAMASWSFSANLQQTGSGTNSITLKSTGSGAGWVRATVGTYTTPDFNVWGGIFVNPVVTGQTAVCPNLIYTYTAQVPGGNSSSYSYSWTYPANWYYYSTNQNNITLQTPASPDFGTVRVAITNACGTSGYSGITVYPGYNCGGYYSLYPNPASTIVNIEIDENSPLNAVNDSILVNNENTNSLVDMPKTYTIRVYNKQGTLLINVTRTGLTFSIPINNLNDGNYVIEINNGKYGYHQQLIIKRD